MFQLRLPRYAAADLKCPVTHTSQYSSGCSLVMVRVKGIDVVSPYGLLVTCTSRNASLTSFSSSMMNCLLGSMQLSYNQDLLSEGGIQNRSTPLAWIHVGI